MIPDESPSHPPTQLSTKPHASEDHVDSPVANRCHSLRTRRCKRIDSTSDSNAGRRRMSPSPRLLSLQRRARLEAARNKRKMQETQNHEAKQSTGSYNETPSNIKQFDGNDVCGPFTTKPLFSIGCMPLLPLPLNLNNSQSPDVTTVSTDLPRDPRLWTRQDVRTWVTVCHSDLEANADRFPMNGKALCIMTVDMFNFRVPHGGRKLYDDFRRRLSAAISGQQSATAIIMSSRSAET